MVTAFDADDAGLGHAGSPAEYRTCGGHLRRVRQDGVEAVIFQYQTVVDVEVLRLDDRLQEVVGSLAVSVVSGDFSTCGETSRTRDDVIGAAESRTLEDNAVVGEDDTFTVDEEFCSE